MTLAASSHARWSTRMAVAVSMFSLVACDGSSREDTAKAVDEPVSVTTESTPRVVTPRDFIRAESDRYFVATMSLAGGVNRFNFGREMLSLDEQTVVRMNRDTLYGGAVIDTAGGATITFPPIPDGRYASVLLIDNDHYALDVIYEPGTYPVPDRTRYVLAAVRVHVHDPFDADELAAVHRLQDQFSINASSAEPFSPPNWDSASLDRLRTQYESEFITYDIYPDEWMGRPGEANEQTRHLAAAGAWGLFPNRDALYINYRGDHPVGRCYEATYAVPDNDAFWSITVYGQDAYMKSDNATLNQYNAAMNPDESVTARFGSEEECGEVSNRLDISDGWNFLMRVYKPGESVLRGDYRLPSPEPLG